MYIIDPRNPKGRVRANCKWFHALRIDNKCKFREELRIFDINKLKDHQFIIYDSTSGYHKLYYILDNISHFEEVFPINKKDYIDEILFANRRQRPIFGVNNYKSINDKNEIREAIATIIGIYGDPPIIIECDKTTMDTDLCIPILSCDFIVSNYAFNNANDAAIITNLIKTFLTPVQLKLFYSHNFITKSKVWVPLSSIFGGYVKSLGNEFTRTQAMACAGLGISSKNDDEYQIFDIKIDYNLYKDYI